MKINQIYFAKTKKDAKIPSKRDEDMCYDIYACFDEAEFRIKPLTVEFVPTGICSAFDKKWGVSLRERGSTGKISLKISSGQIDSGFRGEWEAGLYNGNKDKEIVIKKGIDEVIIAQDEILYPYSKAICQAKVEEVPEVEIIEASLEEILSIKSERMYGKMGSSNK